MKPAVLVFDESGARRFCNGSTLEEEFGSLLLCSRSDSARRWCSRGPPWAWVSTFTVAPLGENQLAISVLGDPTGANTLAQGAREKLSANACNGRFQGPILVRLESPSRELVNPANMFPSAKAFYEEALGLLATFECDLQWKYCPRTMKRPA